MSISPKPCPICHVDILEFNKLKERIAELEAELNDALENPCGDCLKYEDDGTPYTGYGWNENAVEGQVPCGCIEESGPYQILKNKNERLIKALEFYADESIYFPRSIIRYCQEKGVRLAPIYSEFGETAKEAIEKLGGK